MFVIWFCFHVSYGTSVFPFTDAFDSEKLLSAVEMLKQWKAVDIPKYDFKSYKNNISRRVNPSYVIILEGILIFHHPRVRDLMNMKIFVDTDADVRLARRIRHDTGEKGRDIGMVLDQYSKFVKPAFDNFILPTKKSADIIIPRGGDNHIRGMHTLIRDAQTTKHDFVFYEDRLIRLFHY
ncbi:hypothetical protein L2E82_34399 [Cichorium intybus]|uniref:Uncharacterized protein n=1 Tax=Cichorium intybus TaxID=13427 RepID=A0ACB9BM37_CICIN|nr:hypothetical protein L2E82_34399 [Cichorium intybus]